MEGAVTLEVQLDDKGNVADARVLSGPTELRNSTLQSVLQWHFAHDSAGATRQVTVSFQAPAAGTGLATAAASTEKLRAEAAAQNQARQGASLEGRNVKVLTISGLSQPLHDELMSKLPIHQGDTISKSLLEQTTRVAKEFDAHLTVFAAPSGTSDAVVQILAPGAVAAAAEGPMPPQRIRVGGNVQQNKLVSQPRPVYPPDAKAQRIQGKVTLQAIIGKDGTVQSLEVLSGDPLLAGSAVTAVKQWVYQPTLLNGQPVEVQTQIDVNYTLSQ